MLAYEALKRNWQLFHQVSVEEKNTSAGLGEGGGESGGEGDGGGAGGDFAGGGGDGNGEGGAGGYKPGGGGLGDGEGGGVGGIGGVLLKLHTGYSVAGWYICWIIGGTTPMDIVAESFTCALKASISQVAPPEMSRG
jgi:hypothetical protein